MGRTHPVFVTSRAEHIRFQLFKVRLIRLRFNHVDFLALSADDQYEVSAGYLGDAPDPAKSAVNDIPK